MKTLVLTDSEEDLCIAADLIKQGELVAFPTETVYGLGANGLDENAVKKIFLAKGRPQDNPLILHIANPEDYSFLAREITEVAKQLIARFTPGALTLVLSKNDIIPDSVTAGLDSVAIRRPSSKIARRLIELAGVPIAAPSANISGRPSPTCARDVLEDLNGKIAAIIEVGDVNIGLESTVVDCTVQTPKILRPGGVTAEMLKESIGSIACDLSVETNIQVSTPHSPGMKYKHYAPKAQMYVLENMSLHQMRDFLQKQGNGTDKGFLIGAELATTIEHLPVNTFVWKNENELAHILYSALREFDRLGVQCIYAQGIETNGLGLAIMNRMRKSAGFNIITID